MSLSSENSEHLKAIIFYYHPASCHKTSHSNNSWAIYWKICEFELTARDHNYMYMYVKVWIIFKYIQNTKHSQFIIVPSVFFHHAQFHTFWCSISENMSRCMWTTIMNATSRQKQQMSLKRWINLHEKTKRVSRLMTDWLWLDVFVWFISTLVHQFICEKMYTLWSWVRENDASIKSN